MERGWTEPLFHPDATERSICSFSQFWTDKGPNPSELIESPLVEWSVTEVELEEIPLINVEELGESLLALKCGKAPGPDQVTPEILKCTGLGSPTVFLEVFNEISGIFPAAWKTAKVVLIPKPNKPEFIPSSYRPLCLLDTCGKLFECLLVKRLKSALGENGLSPNQFGFRANMSTVQAIQKIYDIADNERKKSYKTRNLCLLITVDIRNAFGSAPWDKIITALEMKNTPSNREEASNQVGETLTADNLIKNMLKSQEDWTTISRLITEIMTTKERDERAEEKTRRIDDQEEEERA
ncbi:hypothetical protein M8J75_007810 [Diaphorina citri]|nr:hypothetical protein M8J75_007810 [Diaphorina citri]